MEKKYIAELPDYEDADSDLVDEMLDYIRENGGLVSGFKASEEDGIARIGFSIKEGDGIEKIEEFGEDMWTIETRDK